MALSAPPCTRCGLELPEGARYCHRCGQQRPRRSGLGDTPGRGAVWVLVTLSLLIGSHGLVILPGHMHLSSSVGVAGVVMGLAGAALTFRAPAGAGARSVGIIGAVLSGAYLLLLPFELERTQRERVARYEASALEAVRSVVDAQTAYADINGGAFDTLACLGHPPKCIPGRADDGSPPLLNPSGYIGSRPGYDPTSAMVGTRDGYERRFEAGPPATPSRARRAHMSPTSLASFAYVAVPVSETDRPLMRSFCGDWTGRVCASAAAHTLRLTDGRCPEDCDPVPDGSP